MLRRGNNVTVTILVSDKRYFPPVNHDVPRYSCSKLLHYIQKNDRLIDYNAVITFGTQASYCRAILRLP